MKRDEAAIVMPWFAHDGLLLRGVRFRFVRQYEIGIRGDGTPRFSQKTVSVSGGGQFIGAVFGTQALERAGAEGVRTFVLNEGELNTCSIWQSAIGTHLDVLGIGSESATISQPVADFAAQYGTRLAWLDKWSQTELKMAALPGAHGVPSPDGKDANDLLKEGALGGFLAAQRFLAAQNRLEQERLYYDLLDASRLPGGVDAGTQEMIGYIAQTLGKA